MNVNFTRANLLGHTEQASVFNGVVWQSLEVNPYSLFNKWSAEKILRKVVALRWPTEAESKRMCLFNLHVPIQDAHAAPIPLETIVVNADDVDYAKATNRSVVIVTMTVTVDHETVLVRQLRTRETPLNYGAAVGFMPIKERGPNDDEDERAPSYWTKDEVEADARLLDLFKTHIPGGASLFQVLRIGHAVELETMQRELDRHDAQAYLDVDPDEQPRRTNNDDDDCDDDDDDAVAGAAAPLLIEEVDNTDINVDEADERVETVCVNRYNELAWLCLLLKHNKCRVRVAITLRCDAKKIMDQWCETAAAYTPCPLSEALFEFADEGRFYITDFDRLNVTEIEYVVSDYIELGSERLALATHVVSASSLPPITEIAPEARHAPTWLDAVDTLDLPSLYYYEIDAYARARLCALMALSLASEALESERAQMLDHWTLKSYPKKSGAKRHILQLLGDDAVRRESAHEAIALAVLALAAKDDARLRANLLMLEILFWRYRNNQLTVLGDDDDDGADDDTELTRHCEAITQFCQRPFVSAEPILDAFLAKLRTKWAHELDEMKIKLE